jgi:hypothetical protein
MTPIRNVLKIKKNLCNDFFGIPACGRQVHNQESESGFSGLSFLNFLIIALKSININLLISAHLTPPSRGKD